MAQKPTPKNSEFPNSQKHSCLSLFGAKFAGSTKMKFCSYRAIEAASVKNIGTMASIPNYDNFPHYYEGYHQSIEPKA